MGLIESIRLPRETDPKRGTLREFGKSLLRLGTVFAVFYVLVCLGARLISTRMIFPAPAPTYGEKLRGLERISGLDGQKFAAVHLPNPAAKHLLIFFHGNGEDLGINLPRLEQFRAAGFAVLAVDYPGYGATGGQPSEEGMCAAADAAYAHATRNLGWAKERIIVYGMSLGGSAAVWVASREVVGGLVLESTFMSAYRVMTRWPLVLGDRLPSLSRMKRVRCPVLVMHGTRDGVIDIEHGRALFAAAPEPKYSLWVEGAGHCQVDSVAGPLYWQTLMDFAAGL